MGLMQYSRGQRTDASQAEAEPDLDREPELDREPDQASDEQIGLPNSPASEQSNWPAPGRPRSSGHLHEVALPYFVPAAPQLSFRLDAELSAWLRWVAHGREGSPQALAAELLTRGLEQETRRARARSLLQLLTPRERQVTELTGQGHTNHQIAHALKISPETVKSHVRNTLSKFGLHSKADLRVLLKELGEADD